MRNTPTPPEDFAPLSELIATREAQLETYLKSLSARDVLDERRFGQLRHELKRAILPEPVVFGQAEIAVVKRRRHSLPAMARRAGEQLQRIFTQVVKIPFTGSKELFRYAPESLPKSCDAASIIKPVGNELCITVHLPFVSREEVLQEANAMLGLTMQFVEANNAAIAGWADSMERRLEAELAQKREAFLELYGSPEGFLRDE